MRVRRASLVEGAQDATGTAVIIDVYRAFTTAAFCVAAGAQEIVLTASHGDALAMKAADPALFLTGEVGGKPIVEPVQAVVLFFVLPVPATAQN